MYGLKHLPLLALTLFSSGSFAKSTTIGLQTAKGSRSVSVPLDTCHLIDEDEVYTVFTSRYCRVFVGTVCNGRQTLLGKGEHSTEIPVPLGSVYCES
ncbi:hypothetical protein EYZ11_007868 [Aspergillus tanneri]|uniref:Uncharacterized protein n=1 Tax=Aspergillus tanneri TaxID=1220188 RepID=A0A4S3JBY6_9EURO|nr:uncharacterized protein ATNIH1004_010558 [Aspergillus tanneri]KAA8643784.1 hypothetical protein ATNIH1004_010558 [Aspergillus tanneri]THC92666.1 hypothetical protein EYZ11_007868 [Aspergillus tanneri]